jgi:tetratricopeptide (TPR) repeat protein
MRTGRGASAVKKQIALWAGHAGREFLIWFGFACSLLLWLFRRLRDASLKDLALIAWIAVFIVISTLIIQDLSRDLVTIEPIATPKAFADGGYTSEVASRRLHDALNDYADNAGSFMRMHVAQSGDLPDFVVPKLDLSLNAIVTSIRSALHSRDSQRITGEFIERDNVLSLRVRVDGHQVYNGSLRVSSGQERDDADALLANAAPQVMDKIRPYLVASTLYNTDPQGALDKADEIVARVGKSDVNAQWSLVLKGRIIADQARTDADQAERDKAKALYREAIKMKWPNWVAHNNLGKVLEDEGKLDEAIAEFDRAVEIEPSATLPLANRGEILRRRAGPKGKLDKAIESYKAALDVDPHNSLALRGLGGVLEQRGDLDSAIAQFRSAIKFAADRDKDLGLYHYNLARALVKKAGDDGPLDEAITECRAAVKLARDVAVYHFELAYVLAKKAENDDTLNEGKFDEAISEYQKAIAINSKYAMAYNNLGVIREELGNLDEAISEYQNAITADPKYALAHNNLGLILENRNKFDDAVREYREAVANDPSFVTAKQNLQRVLNQQEDHKVAKK